MKKFEELYDISVIVYGLETVPDNNSRKTVVDGPLRYAKKQRRTHVNFLIFADELNKIYRWIKDMST